MTYWPFDNAELKAREPHGFVFTNDPAYNCWTCRHCAVISNQYFNCDFGFENEILGFPFREEAKTQVCDSWERHPHAAHSPD